MLDILVKRRSIRKYKDQKVEKQKIDSLMKAALLSPTSKNTQCWEFVIIQDVDILEKLSNCKTHGSSFLKDAPLAIVVLGDSNKSDVWIEDTSIASIVIQLRAQQLDLGSCWIQIRNRSNQETTAEKYIQDVLKIPEHMKVASIISLGYPQEEKKPHGIDKIDYSKIKQEEYV